MDALADALMLEAMFAAWVPEFEPLDAHHSSWARRLFIERLKGIMA